MINLQGSKLAQLPRRLRETQDSAEDLEALLAVLKRLHATFDMSELFSLIVEKAVLLTQADRGCLITVDDDGAYRIEVTRSRAGEPLRPETFSISHTVVQEALASRSAVVHQDAWQCDGLKSKQSICELAIRMVLCAPLQDQAGILGLIYVDSADPAGQAFSARRLGTLNALAGQAAVALRQAGLYREIETLYARTKVLDAAKADFIAIASHELRTPIALISGYSDMLLATPGIGEDWRAMVQGIATGMSRLAEVVNQMLLAAQIDQNDLALTRRPYGVRAFVKDIVESWRQMLASPDMRREIELNYECHLPGESDLLWPVAPAHLEIAVGHLIQNAIKFTPDGGTVTVYLSQQEAGWLRIEVIDTGIGIKSAYRELIFEKFYRIGDVRLHSTGKTKFMGAGPGLGLYLVRGIVTAHGGRVWVESGTASNNGATHQPGSRFIIRLPGEAPEISREVGDVRKR